MYNFLRVCQAVPKVSVADTVCNTANIISKLEDCEKAGADAVLFPELAVTGYTCGDLFFQKPLLCGAIDGIRSILKASEKYSFIIAVGAPLVISGMVYNCAFVIRSGKVCGIVPKTFIPNYNEFYEKRWFASSEELTLDELCSDEIGIGGGYSIPIGRDLVFSVDNKFKLGVEICEDLWAPLPPSTMLALGGAEVIFNLSASNETIAKRKYRRDLTVQQSARLICAYAYTSSGNGESTTDLVFSGHSLVAENGTVIAENTEIIDGDYILTSDVDLDRIRYDRAKLTTFRDCAKVYGDSHRVRTVSVVSKNAGLRSDGTKHPNSKLPFVPSAKQDRLMRCMDIFHMQVAGLKKRLEVTGSRPVVGVSGGLDSTLALLVCHEAVRELGRPSSDVVGITMPCFGTTDRTYNNSVTLIKTLGATFEEINIKDACVQHFADIGHDQSVHDGTYENSQARERTQVLMDYASRVGGFVVGTGDLSELALGWCTYNGDHISMYGVNASIPKTLIRWMIDSLIEYNVFENSTDVLRDVLDTPISPELLPPDEQGRISQQTEDIVGPYALHDYFLYHMLRFGMTPDKILYLACDAFKNDFDRATILKWMKSFYRRFFSQQFKRSCLPDGVKVGSICLSPRGDWRMPSDASAKVWLDMLERL